MMEERAEMLRWLLATFPLKIEYDFWYQFYDDLDDCFDGLEPWLLSPRMDWHGWDHKFTGRRIPEDR